MIICDVCKDIKNSPQNYVLDLTLVKYFSLSDTYREELSLCEKCFDIVIQLKKSILPVAIIKAKVENNAPNS